MNIFRRNKGLESGEVDDILDRVPDLKIEFQTRMNGQVLRTFGKKSEAEAFMQGVLASRRSIDIGTKFKILQFNNGKISRRWQYRLQWKLEESD